MQKPKSLLAKLRLLMILPWVSWNDKKFIMDLNRRKEICRVEGFAFSTLVLLLWSKKEFRQSV